MWNTRSSGEAIPTPDSCIASPAGSVPLSYDLDLGPLLRLNRMIAAEKDCRGLWLAADAGTDASSVVTLGRLWSATGCEVSSQLLMMLLGIGMSSFHRYCVHTILKKQEFTQSSITSHCRRLLSFSFRPDTAFVCTALLAMCSTNHKQLDPSHSAIFEVGCDWKKGQLFYSTADCCPTNLDADASDCHQVCEDGTNRKGATVEFALDRCHTNTSMKTRAAYGNSHLACE